MSGESFSLLSHVVTAFAFGVVGLQKLNQTAHT